MAIKSSGALSFATDIVGEFADSAPHSMSEFYGGGDKVPAGANPGVATSGAINFDSFYDCVAATVLTISSNTNNYDIGAAAIAAGGDKSTPVILTINSGVTCGSTSASTAAMYTGTGWSSGTTITITNNGSIVGVSGSNSSIGGGGHGGNGGNGANCIGCTNGGAGGAGGTGAASAGSAQNGGDAFKHSQTADNNLSVIFSTAGTRTAGSAGYVSQAGGGGGGGGSSPRKDYGGGGGGGGRSGAGGNSAGGAAGAMYGYCWAGTGGGGGSAGTSSGGGSGGNSGIWTSGPGGTGGGYGSAGSVGGQDSYQGCPYGGASGGAGGAAGSTGYAYGSAGAALAGNTGQIS